ncbi:MAG: tetratricopeptide repeat protein [Cyclobacteriaceae bacterium]|nr:tetratricopeptide repeat protein [Cyclobacteriaceae bacterium]
MENQEKDIALIENYLAGKLTGEEANAFRQRLEEDGAFRALFEETKLLISGIQYSARKELLQGLRDLEATLPEVEVTKGFTLAPTWYYGIAAAVLMLVASVFLIPRFIKDSPEALYTAWYAPYPNIIAPITRGSEEEDAPSAGYRQYDLENYDAAIDAFKTTLDQGDDEYVLFYLAVACMSADRHDEAVIYFEQYLQQYTTLTNQAMWYQAMAYMKLKQVEKALPLLEKLVAGGSTYGEKAEKLIDQLE